MLWRLFVFYRRKPWLVVFPCLVCAGTIACMTAGIIMSKPQALMDREHQLISDRLLMAFVILSVSMNIMVTILILTPLVKAKVQLGRYLNKGSQRIYSTIAAILVESAALLALCGICWAIFRGISMKHPDQLILRGRINTLDALFCTLYSAFVALSPLMIINRVLKGWSWKSADDSQNGAKACSPQPTLHFATRPRSTSDTQSL